MIQPLGAEPIGGTRLACDNGNARVAFSPLPYNDPREGKCASPTASGKPCQAWAWAGSDLCYSHKNEKNADTSENQPESVDSEVS